MCMNCGCGMVDDRHGSQVNIIGDDLRQAAQANGMDLPTMVANMRDSLGKLQMSGAGASAAGPGHAGGDERSPGASAQTGRGQAD